MESFFPIASFVKASILFSAQEDEKDGSESGTKRAGGASKRPLLVLLKR